MISDTNNTQEVKSLSIINGIKCHLTRNSGEKLSLKKVFHNSKLQVKREQESLINVVAGVGFFSFLNQHPETYLLM
jgi:hypothetical protein